MSDKVERMSVAAWQMPLEVTEDKSSALPHHGGMRADGFQVNVPKPVDGSPPHDEIEGCPKSVYKFRTPATPLRTGTTI